MSYDQKRRGGSAAPAARAAGRSTMPATPAILAVLVSAAALAAVACGKEGPPTPPLRAVPAPAKDLAVRQRGTHVLLSFTYPQTTPGGSALNGVSKVEVYEAVLQPPAPPKAPAGKAKDASGTAAGGTAKAGTPAAAAAPGAAPGTSAGTPGTSAATPAPGTSAAAPGGTAAAAPSATPQPLDPRQFESLAKPRLTLAGKDIGAATLGNQLLIDLPLPEPLPAAGAASAPVHDWAVRTFGPKGDRSELSNQALLAPKAPPPPPEKVTVTGQADGILVEWQAVPDAGGYAVYRRAATERFSSKPLTLVRQPETRFLDQTARFGQSYIYSVTAVDAKQPLVESAIRSEQEVRYVDRYPPPVPEELVVVAEAGRARLVWRQSEASDLAGYIVYRRGGTGARGDWVRLTAQPITATTWVDTTVASGQSYDYRVTAIDQTGNESAPSAEVHVAVP
jgi:hypothetical protein